MDATHAAAPAGEPGAVKAARPVREEVARKRTPTQGVPRRAAYFTPTPRAQRCRCPGPTFRSPTPRMTAATDEKETNPQSRHRGRRHRIPTRPSGHPDHPETPQAEQQEMDRGNRIRHHRPRPRTRPTSPTPDVASRAAGHREKPAMGPRRHLRQRPLSDPNSKRPQIMASIRNLAINLIRDSAVPPTSPQRSDTTPEPPPTPTNWS